MLLEVENLTVRDADNRTLLHGVSFGLDESESLAIVGSSGAGKSLTAKSVLGLADENLTVSGTVKMNGFTLDEKGRAALLGKSAVYLVQNPMTAFDPAGAVGDRLIECVMQSRPGLERCEVHARFVKAFDELGFRHPACALKMKPSQMSGGMLQRAMVALVIVLKPDLVIADEPTASLDAVHAGEVCELLCRMQKTTGTALVLITHDLGCARKCCREMIVMREGRICETGETEKLFANPAHPYTRQLMQSRSAMGCRFAELLQQRKIEK